MKLLALVKNKLLFVILFVFSSPLSQAQWNLDPKFIQQIRLQANVLQFNLNSSKYSQLLFLVQYGILNNAITGFGNSGSGLSCRNIDKEIFVVMIRDIYEKQIEEQRGIRDFNTSTSDQILMALDRLQRFNPSLTSATIVALNFLMSQAISYTDGEKHPMTGMSDLGPIAFLDGICEEELIAKLEVSSETPMLTFRVSKIHYDALLSDSDRAALWLHESLYFVFRLSESPNIIKTSKIIRELVGELFSQNYDPKHLQQILDRAYLTRTAQ